MKAWFLIITRKDECSPRLSHLRLLASPGVCPLRIYFYTLKHTNKRAGANKPITLNPSPRFCASPTLKTLFHKFNVFFSRGSNMDENIKIDKLDDKIEVRCPTITKDLLSKLSPEQKKNLNLKLLKVMAEAIHLSRLNYSDYLSSDSSATL